MSRNNNILLISGIIPSDLSTEKLDEIIKKYPYYRPARYVAAQKMHAEAPFSPHMLAESMPYTCNWLQFCDFLENEHPTQISDTAEIVEETFLEEPEYSEVNIIYNDINEALPEDKLEIDRTDPTEPEVEPETLLPETITEPSEDVPQEVAHDLEIAEEPLAVELIDDTPQADLATENEVLIEPSAEQPEEQPQEIADELDKAEEPMAVELTEDGPQAELAAENEVRDEPLVEHIDVLPLEVANEQQIIEEPLANELLEETLGVDVAEAEDTTLLEEEIIPELAGIESEIVTDESKSELVLEPSTAESAIEWEAVEEEIIHRFDRDEEPLLALDPTIDEEDAIYAEEIQLDNLEEWVSLDTVEVFPVDILAVNGDQGSSEGLMDADEDLLALENIENIPLTEDIDTNIIGLAPNDPGDQHTNDELMQDTLTHKIDVEVQSEFYAPFSAEDYFMQQGIKISADLPENVDSLITNTEEKDKSLMVMMSFTEWLLHFKNSSEKIKSDQAGQKEVKAMWQKEKLAAALEEETDEIPENVFEMAVNSITREEGLASESLADIYIKQGKFDKAIEMYRKLSLRNPQKNAYFARKIEEVLKEREL